MTIHLTDPFGHVLTAQRGMKRNSTAWWCVRYGPNDFENIPTTSTETAVIELAARFPGWSYKVVEK